MKQQILKLRRWIITGSGVLCAVFLCGVLGRATPEKRISVPIPGNMPQNLLEAVKQKEQADKRLLSLEVFVGITATVTLFTLICIAAFIQMADWLRFTLIGLGFVIFLAGCFCALRIEQVAGYYECKNCHHRYMPAFKAINLAPHIGRSRQLRCPECGKKAWHKKVLTKE